MIKWYSFVVCCLLLITSVAKAQENDDKGFNLLIEKINANIIQDPEASLNLIREGKIKYKNSSDKFSILLEREIQAYAYSIQISTEIKDKSEAYLLYTRTKDSLGVSRLYYRNALVNMEFEKPVKAISFAKTALLFFNDKKDTVNYSKIATMVGNAYWKNKQNDSALVYYRKAINHTANESYLSVIYGNMANVFLSKRHKDSTFYYLTLKGQHTTANDTKGLFFFNFQLGIYYSELVNDYLKAKEHNLLAYSYAQQLPNQRKDYIVDNLAKTYEKLRIHDSASFYSRKYYAIKELLYNSENEEKIVEAQFKNEFEKKREEQIQKEREKEEKYKSDLEKREMVTIFLIGFVIVILFVLVSSYRAYRKKKRLSELLGKQKQIIENKNTLILDSLNYAKRLQNSMLSNESVLLDYFKDCFLIYQPKDIVSGDFYWFHKCRNNKLFLTVADCTGHGVPGAFMSVLGIYSLEQVITEVGDLIPVDTIMNKLNRLITSKLNKKNEDSITDSMDLIIAQYSPITKTLEYAGAKGTFFLIRQKEIQEFKTDNLNLGKKLDFVYQRHAINLQENDQLYFFSDGLPTQKGGAKNSKLNSEAFKKMILEISQEPNNLRKSKLEEKIKNWIGKNEQFDDILVLAVQV